MTVHNKSKRKLSLPIVKFNTLPLQGVLILIIALSLLQLYVSNRFVTEGEKIKAANDQIKELKMENLALEDRIQQLSSLSYLEEQARAMGFIKIDKVEYLTGPAIIASR